MLTKHFNQLYSHLQFKTSAIKKKIHAVQELNVYASVCIYLRNVMRMQIRIGNVQNNSIHFGSKLVGQQTKHKKKLF